MLYHLFDYLTTAYGHWAGARLMTYISFRAIVAGIIAIQDAHTIFIKLESIFFFIILYNISAYIIFLPKQLPFHPECIQVAKIKKKNEMTLIFLFFRKVLI